jgi:hypothetical protein
MLFAIITLGSLIAWIAADVAIFGDDTTTPYFSRKADAS